MVDVVVVLRVLAEIRDVAEGIKENDRQARRLLKRAMAIEAPVLAVQNGTKLPPAESLRQLSATVEKIRNFLEGYARTTKLNRALNRRSNAAKFTQLGVNLTEGMHALQLDVAVDAWAKEDALDRLEDIENMVDMMVTMERNLTENHAEIMDVLETLRNDERSELTGWVEIDYERDLDFDGSALLGSGGFGEVRTAKWNGADVAVKHLLASGIRRDSVRDLRKEIRLHSSLSFDFVTPLYAACTIIPHLCLVVELASGGSLQKYLHSASDPLGHALQAAFLYDIARGMTFLHVKGILHRDLKSANVLMFANGRLKLCDFGLSKVKTDLSSRSTRGAVGTTQWMSPEEMEGSPANELTDMYSFGVLCFEVVTRTEPFKGKRPAHVIGAVLYRNERPQIPEGASASPEVVPLMEQCWRQDPVERPEGFGPVVRALASVVSRVGDPRNHNAATAHVTPSPGEAELTGVDGISADLPAVDCGLKAPDMPNVSMPNVSVDVSVPVVPADVSVPDVSGSPKVPDVSGGVSMPSLDMDVPLGSAEVPSVDLAGKMPEMPSVEGGIGDELASGDVSVTAPDVKVEGGDTSLTAGLAAGGVAAVGATGAAVGLSCDRRYAELPAGDVEASVAVPDVPSVDVKKPKKGIFGGPFGSGKAKVEVPSVGLTGKMPETPEMTSLEGGVGDELPSGVTSVTAADAKVEGGDSSLNAGLAAGGVAAVGAIGATVGISGNQSDADLSSGNVEACVSVPEAPVGVKKPNRPSVEVRKSKKVLFGGLSLKKSSCKISIEVPDAGVAVSDVSAPDATASRPEASGDVAVPDVGVDVAMPSIGAEASAAISTGDAKMPSVDVPRVGVELQAPVKPSAGDDIAGSEPELPSVDASSCCCWVFTFVAVVLAINAIAGTDYSTLVIFIPQFIIAGTLLCCAICFIYCMRDAEGPLMDASLISPEVPSVDVKKPKKSKFGQKNPQFMKKGKTYTPEIPGVNASTDVPSISGDTSVEVPGVSIDAPSNGPSVDVPSVTADASLPSASVDVPPAEEDASMPSVGDLSADVGTKAGDLSANVGAKVGDVEADLGAKVDDISAKAPDVISVEVPDVDASVPAVSAEVSVPDVSGSLPVVSAPGVSLTAPDVGADVSVPEVPGSVEVPAVQDVSGDVSLPDVRGDVSLPGVSADVSASNVAGSPKVPDVSADVYVPDFSGSVDVTSVDIDVPFGSVEVPSVDLAGKMPEMPSLEGGAVGELSPGGVSVTAPDVQVEGGDTSLTAGLAAGGVATVGAIGAAVGLSGDKPDAELPSGVVHVSLSIPEASVDVKTPRKVLFGGFSFKKPPLMGRTKGEHEKVEPLFERSLAIHEKSLGPDHPLLAAALHNRGKLLMRQGKYEEAGPLLERSLAIYEKSLGPHHPLVATVLNEGKFLMRQGKYEEAGPLLERSLTIYEKSLGTDSPHVATALDDRAKLLVKQGKHEKVEPLFEHSLAIHEKSLGPDHPLVAAALHNRGKLLMRQGKCEEAGPLLERSLAIYEKSLGPHHPLVATMLHNRAALLMSQGKYDEAEPLYRRSLAIDEEVHGRDHPEVATDLSNWAGLLKKQGKYAEADPLYLRAIEIGEKTLGPDHPALATRLNNRALLLGKQGKYEEAGPLLERSLAIYEKSLRPDHPEVATALHSRANLLMIQDKYAEAMPPLERSLSIRAKKLGGNRQHTVNTRDVLQRV